MIHSDITKVRRRSNKCLPTKIRVLERNLLCVISCKW